MRIQPSREDLVELTRLNPFDRFPDGRPCVPSDLLERMRLVTTEEAWAVLRNHGYHRQFEGNWLETHPGKITVGRAVTAQFLPHRADYHDAIRHRIAGILELSPFQIGLKAKTGEGAGPIGREEVIEARCVALLEETGERAERGWLV